jgi:hypothetical protein
VIVAGAAAGPAAATTCWWGEVNGQPVYICVNP